MQQNILNLHNKISLSLAKSLKDWNISNTDAIAYMIFFDALWEDEKLIKSCIVTIWKIDNIFKNLILDIKWDEKELIDVTSAMDLLNKIKTNTF